MKDKGILFRIDEKMAHEFKVACAVLNKSKSEVLVDFVKQFIEKNKVSVEWKLSSSE